MWHCAWDGECHVDARWRLRRQAAFNGIGGEVSLSCGLSFLVVVLLWNLFPFAWGGFLVKFFLGLRLYLLLVVEEVCWSILFFSPSIFPVLVGCSARDTVVDVLGGGGCMLWALYWLCCVFCRFVWFCSRLWFSSYVPPALYLLL